ncbi:MAG: hypothetical protein K2M53_01925 [Muribaculaceae bacterium]|nr:hypothetical protein [Muribaculaceae bacterium]
MKKLYSTLALAAVVALSASAASPFNAKSAVKSQLSEKTVEIQNSSVKAKAKVASEKAPKKLKSVEDVYGQYICSYEGMLQNNEGPQVLSPTIKKSSRGGNSVVMTNFPFSDTEIEGSVDLEKSTVTFPKQIIGFNPYYNEDMVFVVESANPNNPDRYPAPADGAFTGKINDDGTISFNYWEAPCVRVEAGYFWAGCFVEFSPLHLYTVDESKWKVAGTCEYSDGFMAAGMAQGQLPAYKLTVLSNPDVEGEFAVKNPYSAETSPFVEANEKENATGYIVFNISNPDCVTVRPLVGSGLWMDNSEELDGSMIEEVFCYNSEGSKYYINDVSTEDQVEEVYIIMDDDETLAEYLSSYNASTKTVTILGFNSYFAFSGSPLSEYFWTQPADNEDGYIRKSMNTSIVFDFDPTAGVEGIVADDANAPVKYYNLQGMEVANPEAGQLVIKKQGSKTVKVIAE